MEPWSAFPTARSSVPSAQKTHGKRAPSHRPEIISSLPPFKQYNKRSSAGLVAPVYPELRRACFRRLCRTKSRSAVSRSQPLQSLPHYVVASLLHCAGASFFSCTTKSNRVPSSSFTFFPFELMIVAPRPLTVCASSEIPCIPNAPWLRSSSRGPLATGKFPCGPPPASAPCGEPFGAFAWPPPIGDV